MVSRPAKIWCLILLREQQYTQRHLQAYKQYTQIVCCARRVPSTLRPLLGASAASKDELYSEEQMRSVLAAYAAADNLQIDSSNVKLDKLMVSNLFNKKEPQMEGDACSLEEVVKRLLGKLQLFHKVTRVTEQVGLP